MVDAGALCAVADANDPRHADTLAALERWPGELVESAFTAAEADHLILSRLGVDAQLAFVEDLANAYVVRSLESAGIARAHAVCARYRELEIGLADASIVVLAAERETHAVATFDQRHFRTVMALDGRPFTLVPVDEPGS